MAALIKVHSIPARQSTPIGARDPDDFSPPGDFAAPPFSVTVQARNPEISGFIAGVGGTKWVKVWVSWYTMQGGYSTPPPDIWTSWGQLASVGNSAAGKYFDRLDLTIKAINNAGYGATLQIDEQFPDWSNTNNWLNYGSPSIRQEKVFPDSVAANSPWGWWISYLICRYKQGVPPNPAGPTQSNYYGNPKGASLYALEFCNEPNIQNEPRSQASCYAANMFTTIEYIASVHWPYSSAFGGVILGPGTSDSGNYDTFTKQVLGNLPAGWQPRVYIGWSHHNYADIDDTVANPPPANAGTARIRTVRQRLQGGWTGDTNNPWRNGDRNVYITEGARRHVVDRSVNPAQDLSSAQEQDQVNAMNAAFGAVRDLNNATGGAYPLFAQHQINDFPWQGTKYGLRRNWNEPAWAPSTTERPSANVWRNL